MTIYSGTAGRLGLNRQVTHIGALAGAGLLTTGRLLFLSDLGQGGHPEFQDIVPPGHLFTGDIEAIESSGALRNGANDYILICPKDSDAAWDFTTDVQTISYSNVHIIGLGHRTRIAGTTTGSSTGIINVTGDGVEIANLAIEGGTGNQVALSFATGGDRGWVHDCRIAAAAATATFDIGAHGGAQNAGGLVLQRCVVGDLVASGVNAHYLYDTASSTRGLQLLEDCIFLINGIHASAAFLHFQATFTAQGDVMARRCVFYNAGTAMTDGFDNSGTANFMLLGCQVYGVTALGNTGKGWVSPAGVDLAVAGATAFNAGLAIDVVSPVAADT